MNGLPPKQSGVAKLPITKNEKPLIVHGEQVFIDQIDIGLRSALRACVLGEKPWPLFIWGSPGAGKTCAALCLLNYCERPGEYFTVRMLCEQMNESALGRLEWNSDGRGGKMYPGMFRKHHLSRPSLLVLDEIGARNLVSDAHYEAIMTVLDLRANKPFIAISNLDPAALEKVYDGRIVSRLSAGTMIELAGADRRI